MTDRYMGINTPDLSLLGQDHSELLPRAFLKDEAPVTACGNQLYNTPLLATIPYILTLLPMSLYLSNNL